MTPDPPPNPPDGDKSLPPRHRPLLDDLAKDTTEQDLWDFEAEDDLDSGALSPDEPPRPPTGALPEPRDRRVASRDGKTPAGEDKEAAPGEQVRMNVGKKSFVRPDPTLPPGGSLDGSDFDDLESWDDTASTDDVDDLPSEPVVALGASQPEHETIPETPVVDTSAPVVTPPSDEDDEDDEDEFTPHPREDVKPLPLRPRLGLSAVERLGMIAVLALLIVGGGFAFFYSVMRLPSESARARTTDFPIKGDRLTVRSADTYWREPVTRGPDADTFRRGTRLLPVIELTVEGTGAVRVLFRDEERRVMGDAVTRSVRGTATLRLPATAGFEDPGMHAAYRTGGTKPWTAEVFEAESVDASGRAFEKLFEINISTERR